MEEEGWTGKTVTLKFKLDTYQVFTRAKSFNHWVSKKEELFGVSVSLQGALGVSFPADGLYRQGKNCFCPSFPSRFA